jgi:ER degradation enhancer, mannosidase alpha-like 2
MGGVERLRDAVAWLGASLSFDIDARVHVFELTIRALGGLLSTHVLLQRNASLVPGYDGSLLRLGVELADRLLPAFDTPSGIPLSWVNLRTVRFRV